MDVLVVNRLTKPDVSVHVIPSTDPKQLVLLLHVTMKRFSGEDAQIIQPGSAVPNAEVELSDHDMPSLDVMMRLDPPGLIAANMPSSLDQHTSNQLFRDAAERAVQGCLAQ